MFQYIPSKTISYVFLMLLFEIVFFIEPFMPTFLFIVRYYQLSFLLITFSFDYFSFEFIVSVFIKNKNFVFIFTTSSVPSTFVGHLQHIIKNQNTKWILKNKNSWLFADSLLPILLFQFIFKHKAKQTKIQKKKKKLQKKEKKRKTRNPIILINSLMSPLWFQSTNTHTYCCP